MLLIFTCYIFYTWAFNPPIWIIICYYYHWGENFKDMQLGTIFKCTLLISVFFVLIYYYSVFVFLSRF